MSTLHAIGASALLFAGTVIASQTSEMQDALRLKPHTQHGHELFQACAACHQANGVGAADRGVPAIAGQHYQVILQELVDFRSAERFDLRMEASASRHRLRDAQDLADVAAYVATLPPQPTTDLGPGHFLAAGHAAYARACVSCHGVDGEGKDWLRSPRLSGQHYHYLLTQMDTMIGGSRFNAGWDHAQLLRGLTDHEIPGVAEYLARLGAARAASGDQP